MLVNKDNFVADSKGNIINGPKEDKEVLRNTIAGKSVLVGKTTWDKDISKYPKLVALAYWFVLSTEDTYYKDGNVFSIQLGSARLKSISFCLGGPKVISMVKPRNMIIHRIKDTLQEGILLSLKDYELLASSELKTYSQEYYKLKRGLNGN